MLTPATTLDDVYKTVNDRALTTHAELEAFYIADVNQLRGDDRVKQMALRLRRATEEQPYRALLMSHMS